jgi:hypothetical protein
MPASIGPRKYAPLTAYLAARTGDAVTLTLAEIEQIIAAPLPVSARRPSFWSNGPLRLFRERPWIEAGWRVVRTELRRAEPAVTFARVAADATR